MRSPGDRTDERAAGLDGAAVVSFIAGRTRPMGGDDLRLSRRFSHPMIGVLAATLPWMELSRPVERSVAEGVLAYLADAVKDDHQVADFADSLGRMFQQLLEETPSWSRYWWIDDALPQQVIRVDDSTVELVGMFVPGDDQGHQWIQPFRATLRIDSPTARVVAYHVDLGDKDVAMEDVAWGAKRPKHWPDVTRWAYTFEGPG
jgi:hypothetical protein